MARTKGSRNLTPGTPGGRHGAAKVNGKPVKEGLREIRAARKAHAGKAQKPAGKPSSLDYAAASIADERAKYFNPSNPTR